MRKSPEIKERVCVNCGIKYKPQGNTQKYCLKCKSIKENVRKKNWYKRNFPDSKPKEKCKESCCVCGGTFSCHYEGKPYCNKHYLRMKIHGNLDVKKRESTNVFVIEDDVLKIITKKGETILADPSLYEKLKQYSWCVSKTGYAVANIKYKVQKMHRYILELEDSDVVVDHINHNKLDNRKANLRICTNYENSKNQCGNKNRDLPMGISFTANGKYRARIMVDRKEIRLGTFDDLHEAVKARIEAEEKYFGEFSQAKSFSKNNDKE